MRKVIAAINVTLDGICDHTAVGADDELHEHYAELIRNAGLLVYGRKTYELMKYWQTLIKQPSGNKALDEFAAVMDRVPKLVFSHTMEYTGWHSASLATQTPGEAISDLRQQPGESIIVGSRSLIMQLLELRLVDEFQLCIHPVVAGSGLPLFKPMSRIAFSLEKTRKLKSGATVHYYAPLETG